MIKALYRLFGGKKAFETTQSALEQECIVAIEQGAPITVTYKNFSKPGLEAKWW